MSSPYYTPVSQPLLSPQLCEQLVAHTLRNPQEVQDHLCSKTGVTYGLSYIMDRDKDLAKTEVAALRRKCALSFSFSFSMKYVRPNAHVGRHTDITTAFRGCVIIIPLYPVTGYAPTLFWETMESTTPIAALEWDDMPALVNVQVPHSVENNDSIRFNAQLGFRQSYDVVREMLISGKLFR